MNMTKSDIEYNGLYLCCIVQSLPEKFQENGAVVLNHMLQSHANLKREEAFSIISDSIKAGYLFLDKKNLKKLSVVDEKYRPLRDKMIELIGRIQAEVASLQWKLKTPRQLSQEEQDSLKKMVSKGKLWDVKKDVGEKLSNDIFYYFDSMVSSVYSKSRLLDPDEYDKTQFSQYMTEALQKFASSLGDRDFVLLVTKSGKVVNPRLKIIDSENQIQIDFDQF